LKYSGIMPDPRTMSTALRALLVAFLCATAVVSGCNGVCPSVRGSGVLASETRDVAGFNEVRVSGSGDVVIEQTGAESLTVQAEDNVLPLLETRVSHRVLHLGLRPNANVRVTRPIRYHVTVKGLTGVAISGSGSVRASGIDTDKLTAEISGSGSADLAGRADVLALSVSGSGSYDAGDLRSKTARIAISGSGDAFVNASERVDATISGSGSVRYAGNPSVSQHVSGSGSIARR
jgi:hypothetical protein